MSMQAICSIKIPMKIKQLLVAALALCACLWKLGGGSAAVCTWGPAAARKPRARGIPGHTRSLSNAAGVHWYDMRTLLERRAARHAGRRLGGTESPQARSVLVLLKIQNVYY